MDLVLCWHMHQPDYRHQGRSLKPWTWLHAIKDYSDMAAHLERAPGARAVINFSPVLMLQLQAYPQRIRALLQQGTPIEDPILDALAGQLPGRRGRLELTRALLRVNKTTMKPRFPAYQRLFEAASRALEAGQALGGQELDDLLTWYVLLWLGESLRGMALPARLQQQARAFALDDRRALLQWLADVIEDLLPRYRALAERGTIELSVTPWSHPILPLLLDLESARESMPDATLPRRPYPGGAQRCDWQLAQGLRVFRETFGQVPAGCWPSEGALSNATLSLLGRHGFRWTASGAQVLFNSLGSTDGLPQLDAWKLAQAPNGPDTPLVFFRDDALSDRIGFEYARWPAADAVADFIAHIEQRLDAWTQRPERKRAPVLSIIMDGENAWEYYPANGHEFLELLYARLTRHPRLRLTTFSEALERHVPRILPALVAGSWVHGTFSTWIGDPAKNRAWALLAHAKSAADAALAPVREQCRQQGQALPGWVEEIQRQLAVCEASDWFWWLGPDNRLQDGPEFDRLFRLHLAELYVLLGTVPPAELEQPLDDYGYLPEDAPSAQAGAMRQATE